MENAELFDAVLRDLGFKRAIELAAALRKAKQSTSYYRTHGFPRLIILDLQALSERLQRPFSDSVQRHLEDRLRPKQPDAEAA
jgi:hypothetical protein